MFDYSWLTTLNKPAFAPPAWVFSPVWTILYIMIFIALIVYAKKSVFLNKKWGFFIFFTQLIVNFAWTPIFFGLHNIGLALAVIILLDILVLFNIIEFFKVSKSSAYLLIPYFIWIIFATYLNLGYFILN